MPLRILFVEDSDADAELIRLHLELDGVQAEFQRVDDEPRYLAALEATPNLILSDYSLPRFNGLRALQLLRERKLDIPFILISGTVGEDIAVNAIKQGADDYIMKDRLSRLGSAIQHALEQRRLRFENQQTDEALRRSQQAYSDLVNTIDGIVWESDAKTFQFHFVSEQAEKVLGYPVERWTDEPDFWKEHIHPDDRAWVIDYCIRTTRQKITHEFEYRMLAADGRSVWMRDVVTVIVENDQPSKLRGIMTDITDRKKFEDAERQRSREAETLREAIIATITSLQHDEIITRILEQLELVVPHDSASVQILHDGYLEIVGGHGWENPQDVIGIHFPVPGDNPNSTVIQTRRPLIVQDIWEASPQFRMGPHSHIRSWMGIPLMIGDRVTGMLAVDSRELDHFTENDARLASAFAAQVSIALENARLFKETSTRLENLQTLNRISTSLRTAQTKDEILEILLDETLSAFRARNGAIWIFDTNTKLLRMEAMRGWLKSFQYIELRPSQGLNGRVFSENRSRISNEVANDPWLMEEARVLTPIGWNQVSVPIRTARETIGVLLVAVERPRQIQQAEVDLLITIAEMAGNAIHRATLHELTEHRLRNLESLHEIERAISSSLDVRITLNLLLDKAISGLGVQAAAVLLFDPILRVLNFAAGRGFRTQGIESSRLRLGEGQAGIAIQERRVVAVLDLNQTNVAYTRMSLIEEEGFFSYYCAPLIAKGRVKGVLETYHRLAFTADSEWIDFLETLAAQAAVAIDNAELVENLQHSNLNLALAYDATIEGWSHALDLRDKETEGHTQRVTDLTLQLARRMDVHANELIQIRRGALLHDIGKMGVPDRILHKPESLTEAEWEIMRRHPVYAYEMLRHIEYLRPALDIPYCHHEKWDGSGYPRGLAGDQIPLAARIFAVADVWDALTNDRIYRKALPEEQALAYIKEQSGQHFDPQIVESFLTLIVDRQSVF